MSMANDNYWIILWVLKVNWQKFTSIIDDFTKITDATEVHARSLCTIIVIYIMCVDTLLYKISEISIHKSHWWSRHSQQSYDGQWLTMPLSQSTNQTPSLKLKVTIIMTTLKEMTKVRWCRVLRALLHPHVTREGNFFADSRQ